jgi:Spy/CpxP family protein refolding chaperone
MHQSLRALSTGVVAGGLMLFSTVAIAQGGAGRRGGPPPGNPDQPAPSQNAQPPRMSPMPGSPAEMLLRQRERLELTDDQAKRLEALGKTQRDALKPQRSNMLRAQADLADAEERENLDAQRSALEKLAKIRIDEDIAHRKAMKDARDVLTAEQRDRAPGAMMGGRGRGGMGGGRGMMGGARGGGRGMMGGARGGMAGGRGGVPSAMPRRRPPVGDTTPSGANIAR